MDLEDQPLGTTVNKLDRLKIYGHLKAWGEIWEMKLKATDPKKREILERWHEEGSALALFALRYLDLAIDLENIIGRRTREIEKLDRILTKMDAENKRLKAQLTETF